MATLSATRRKRLDTQGLVDVDDATLASVGRWMGLAFGVCATLAAVGAALASPLFLWFLVPIAVLATVSPVHPVDFVYNHTLRHVTGTPSIPKRAMPTRFGCGVGTVWMLATIWAFESGNTALGYGLGGALSCVALLVATTDICIPSMIYEAIFGPTKPCSAR